MRIFDLTGIQQNEAKEQKSLGEEDKENDSVNKTGGKEKPLTNVLQSLLGDDPTISKAKKVSIHSDLVQHWSYYVFNGLSKEDREELIGKYEIPTKLVAPCLNEQLNGKLNDKSIKRDNYRYETQKLVSMALTSLGGAMTMVNDAEDGIDEEKFLEKLSDAAKAMADVQFQLCESRKAFITPRFTKPFQEILKNTKSDTLLYGTELASKIKESKEANTLLKDINTDPLQKPQGKSGNFRRPLGARNNPIRAGGYSNTSGQDRPKLYFKKYPKNTGFSQGHNPYQKPKRFQKNK